LLIVALLGIVATLPAMPPVQAGARNAPTVEASVQGFLDAQPGPLKSYRDGEHSAAELIQSASLYYGLSPRVVLALLEATGSLLSAPTPPAATLAQPFGPAGPAGFAAQIDWAARELRAGLGPYDRPPTLQFTDGTTLTLTLQQAPEGVAVQRFLAKGRDQAAWRATVERFGQAFQVYFNNEIPQEQHPAPTARSGFLQQPWPVGTRVVHLAYFDHMYPTVDTGKPDNGFVVNYLGHGNVQYDGHDGHDFYFPDQPIGTYILAAAAGTAYARTHRGNGVVIVHPGGYETVYWHLDKFASIFKGKIDTDQGVAVRAGDLLGSSGKSGFTSGTPHLHFEVRHNGREVDPYGWYGPGPDPCGGYAGCEASVWLWRADVAGLADLTPPGATTRPDRTPPNATLTVNPTPDLLFLARFDSNPLQQVGVGLPMVSGAPVYEHAQFDDGVRVPSGAGLSYPLDGNLRLDAGTIAFWARLPDTYPANGTGRNYLLAASAHADEGPVYTGTLALRRDRLGPHETPRWDFWTTPQAGEAGRDDLTVPDTLAPGLHHFAITWSRDARSKALYLDGALVIATTGVELPEDVGAALELGRFTPGAGLSDVTFDDLAIFSRALTAPEVKQLVATAAPVRAGAARVGVADLRLDANALDDAGGIMSAQIGVNGVFGDPQPYEDSYDVRLPQATGVYTVAARFFDRANNSATVSTTVSLVQPSEPFVQLDDVDDLNATLVFSTTGATPGSEMQAGPNPDLSNADWQPLVSRLRWEWSPNAPHVVWVRFREPDGLMSTPRALGPDAPRLYLPLVKR
jgi:murein DD-endopeptidase MepM/ murein hydrolase activator NlpD